MTSLPATTLDEWRRLIWGADLTDGDIERWHQQGMTFSDYDGSTFGLLQSSGGPCGVLAAVGAFTLAHLLGFDVGEALASTDGGNIGGGSVLGGSGGSSSASSSSISGGGGGGNCGGGERAQDRFEPPPNYLVPGEAARGAALVEALASILWQARQTAEDAASAEGGGEPGPACVVTCSQLPCSRETLAGAFTVTPCASMETLRVALAGAAEQWETPSGIVLFLFSILATRSVEAVRADMDDPSANLTGQVRCCVVSGCVCSVCSGASTREFLVSVSLSLSLLSRSSLVP